MKLKQILCVLVWIGLAAGCEFPITREMLPTVPPELIPTELPAATLTMPPEPIFPTVPTPTFEPTALPSATLSPTPYKPFTVLSDSDNINVRTNPGFLFEVVMRVHQDTPFKVLGRTPGGEWLLVESDTKKQGWIYSLLVKSDQDLMAPPVVEPKFVQVVKGQVMDAQNKPISGIQFSLIQGSGVNKLRNDAVTDATGVFYAYMPQKAKGEWAVSYTATICISNTMDSSCKCKKGTCGAVSPLITSVVLPQKTDLVFVWK
jgi:hypothetical protein